MTPDLDELPDDTCYADAVSGRDALIGCLCWLAAGVVLLIWAALR